MNPLNETYPDNFNLHRTELHHIAIPPNNSSRLLKMTNPLPGSWFAITFINDYTDDKLTVKVSFHAIGTKRRTDRFCGWCRKFLPQRIALHNKISCRMFLCQHRTEL